MGNAGFWVDAGIFVQKYSGTSHCRTGKTFKLINLLSVIVLQALHVGQESPKY